MILKFYDLKKIDFKLSKIFLFYGKNEGLKNETINNLIINKNEISKFDETEILNNRDNFIENILSRSLFEEKKNNNHKKSFR